MDVEDEDYLMLSGIQHFQFCKRQWALIHIEQHWLENFQTIEGNYLHRRADQPLIREKRGDKIVVRALPVKSETLKIYGICDVVEFKQNDNGVTINGTTEKYLPYPVEYKRGRPKHNDADVLQLAAQAVCLEEMLLCDIDVGYLFYKEIQHRVEVLLTAEIKIKVGHIVGEMQEYFRRRHTPKVNSGPFCKNCSLQDICLPKLTSIRSVKTYVEGKIQE